MAEVSPLDTEENPSWVLDTPDVDDIEPPIDTLERELPFEKLSWQNFERLCLKLAGTDGDAEYYRLYGTAGQGQGGIDVYVRRRSTAKYATWQSKRHKSFYPSDIEKAVIDFLAGDWAAKSDRFVLCVRASLRSTGCADKIEECAIRLREKGIEFNPCDGEQLSTLLKPTPQIVYDFFGLAWVKRFCGEEAAQSVAKRLKPTEYRQLREKLSACYASHFSSVDPGVLGLTTTPLGERRRLPLDKRFVVPDLLQQNDIAAEHHRQSPHRPHHLSIQKLVSKGNRPVARAPMTRPAGNGAHFTRPLDNRSKSRNRSWPSRRRQKQPAPLCSARHAIAYS